MGSARDAFFREQGQIRQVTSFEIDDLDHFVGRTRPRHWATFTGFATKPEQSNIQGETEGHSARAKSLCVLRLFWIAEA
jgi:hypothetical protein